LQHASLEIDLNIYMEGVLRSQQRGYSLKPVHSGAVPSMRRRFFWATVYITVCPMLSDHCPLCLSGLSVCLSCLSVTLVYCGQTVRWVKTKLVTEVGLCPGHTVLDRDPALPLRCTLDVAKFSFRNRVVNEWNMPILDEEVISG